MMLVFCEIKAEKLILTGYTCFDLSLHHEFPRTGSWEIFDISQDTMIAFSCLTDVMLTCSKPGLVHVG